MEGPIAPISSLALGWMVSVESVWLPSWPSQTRTSSAPPARNPSTAALISPVNNWRISGSLGSVWSWRQMPPTPSASVMRKTVFVWAHAAEQVKMRRNERKRISIWLTVSWSIAMSLDTQVRYAGGITIFDLTGRLVSGLAGDSLRDKLFDAFEHGHRF